MVVWLNGAAGRDWRGHGFQRVGSDGQRALRISLLLPVAPARVGSGRTRSDGPDHALRLSPAEAARHCFYSSGSYDSAVVGSLFSRSFAQYASLGTTGRAVISALRAGQTGADSISGVFSGEPHQID